jgi:hypothetical protein
VLCSEVKSRQACSPCGTQYYTSRSANSQVRRGAMHKKKQGRTLISYSFEAVLGRKLRFGRQISSRIKQSMHTLASQQACQYFPPTPPIFSFFPSLSSKIKKHNECLVSFFKKRKRPVHESDMKSNTTIVPRGIRGTRILYT